MKMSANSDLMDTLFKLNLLRMDAQKTRDIYQMKFKTVFEEFKKTKENEIGLRKELNFLKKKISYDLESSIENKKSLMETIIQLKSEKTKNKKTIQKLEEENENLKQEINIIKQDYIEEINKVKSELELEREKNQENIQKLNQEKENRVQQLRNLHLKHKEELSRCNLELKFKKTKILDNTLVSNDEKQDEYLGMEIKDIWERKDTEDIWDATKKGDLEAVQYWFHLDSTNLHDKKHLNSPLHYAAELGFLHILTFLSKYLEIDLKNIRDETPLHLASKSNQFQSVKILLANGAKINCKTIQKETPLYFSCARGNSRVMEHLLSEGADIEAGDLFDYRPLHVAVIGYHFYIVKCLLEKGANKDAKGGFLQQTPLHLAYVKNDKRIIDYLKEHGANQNILDMNGKTPQEYI